MPETISASPTVTEPAAATPSQAPAPSSETTVQNTPGDANGNGQGAPGEETFFSGDPKTLPPQLRTAYENMLRDYKTKTGKLSEERKAVETVKQKAELYDQISSDEAFVKYWNSLTKKEQDETKEAAQKDLGVSDEEFSQAFESKDKFFELMKKMTAQQTATLQQRLDEAHKKLQTSEAEEIINAFAAAEGEDGKPVRPDFDELAEKGLITFFLSKEPPAKPQEYAGKLEKAYKNSKELAGYFYAKGKNEALGIVAKKAGNSSETPSLSGPEVWDGPDPSKLSVAEAVAYARQRKVVPRNF